MLIHSISVFRFIFLTFKLTPNHIEIEKSLNTSKPFWNKIQTNMVSDDMSKNAVTADLVLYLIWNQISLDKPKNTRYFQTATCWYDTMRWMRYVVLVGCGNVAVRNWRNLMRFCIFTFFFVDEAIIRVTMLP